MMSPETAATRWPARPYKGFGNYGPEDVALFAGRDQEIAEFSRSVATPAARLVLLHGPSGCGKSSFLRAGVIPFLESRQAGFAFVKDPNDPTIRPEATDATAVFVRSTANPLATLADAIFRLADRGYDYMSPDGPEHAAFAAAKRGCTSAEEFVSSIAAGPLELVAALESMAAELPFKLVLIVDQAEEVVTLRHRRHVDANAERFFVFLNAFGGTRWPLSLILSLRTEFYGALLTHLRRRSASGDVNVHDYFLDELGRAGTLDAILRPTLATPIRGAGAPRDFYGFSFEEGLPERIVDDLAEAADVRGLVSGTLPFLQIVCESLYKTSKLRKGAEPPWVITRDDYSSYRVLETMAQYIDDMLDAGLRPLTGAVDLARSRWKDVLATLAKTQADGSITTIIRTADDLRKTANKVGAQNVDTVLAYLAADEQSVLRRDRRASSDSTELYSLRHDAIGLVLSLWRATRDSYQKELVFKDGIREYMPSVDTIEQVCTLDTSGSGTQVRRWLGVSSRQNVVDYRIQYAFGVSSGRVIVPPEGIVTAIAEPSPSALSVRFVEQDRQPDSLTGYVEICGRLDATTGFVGFEVREGFELAFRMSRAEVEAEYTNDLWKTEYIGIFVQLPTGRLLLTMQFPETFRSPTLEAGPVVFIGSGEKTHDAEIARIQSSFKLEDTLAILEVTEPLQGLQYAIYWMPPS